MFGVELAGDGVRLSKLVDYQNKFWLTFGGLALTLIRTLAASTPCLSLSGLDSKS